MHVMSSAPGPCRYASLLHGGVFLHEFWCREVQISDNLSVPLLHVTCSEPVAHERENL